MADQKNTSTKEPLNSTDLSFERTILSHERTLMSWIRTSSSMITFGFSIYKILEQINPENQDAKIFTPRLVGMTLILIGLAGLFLAMIQHIRSMKRLKQNYPNVPTSIALILGVVIILMGAGLFVGALLRQ